MPAEPFDATPILKAIQNRAWRNRSATPMLSALEAFLASPSVETLTEFSKLEKIWRSGRSGVIDYSYELGNALKARRPITHKKREINSPHNVKFDPPWGYIYGMISSSSNYQGLVKLGVTSRRRHPQDRLKEFEKKYPQASAMEIIFLCETAYPARAEQEWTRRLSHLRARMPANESREWFQSSPLMAYQLVHRIVNELSLKQYSPWYRHKTKLTATTQKQSPAPLTEQILPFIHGDWKERGRLLVSRHEFKK